MVVGHRVQREDCLSEADIRISKQNDSYCLLTFYDLLTVQVFNRLPPPTPPPRHPRPTHTPHSAIRRHTSIPHSPNFHSPFHSPSPPLTTLPHTPPPHRRPTGSTVGLRYRPPRVSINGWISAGHKGVVLSLLKQPITSRWRVNSAITF